MLSNPREEILSLLGKKTLSTIFLITVVVFLPNAWLPFNNQLLEYLFVSTGWLTFLFWYKSTNSYTKEIIQAISTPITIIILSCIFIYLYIHDLSLYQYVTDHDRLFYAIGLCVIIATFLYFSKKTEHDHDDDKKYNSQITKTDYLPFFIVLTLALSFFVIRLWLGVHSNPDLDEGQLIYDAKLVYEGLIPFKDFTTRAPLLVYSLVAIGHLQGGFYLIGGKILIAILYSIATVALYLLTKEVTNSKKTAVIAAILFSIVPSYLFYSTALHIGQASVLFLIGFCYFFVRYIKTQNPTLLLISGLTLGVGYLVRRDLIIYTAFATAFLVYLIFFNKNSNRHTLGTQPFSPTRTFIVSLLYFSVGFGVGLTPLLYLIYHTDILWMDKFYGLTSLLGQSLGKSDTTINSNKWPILFSFILTNFFIIAAYCKGFVVTALHRNTTTTLLWVTSVVAVMVLVTTLPGEFKTGGYNIYKSSGYIFAVFLSWFAIGYLSVPWKNTEQTKEIFTSSSTKFILFLFAYYYLILFFVLKEFNTNYFIITLFVPIIIISIVFSQINTSLINKIVVGVIFVSYSLFMQYEMFTTYTYERSWTLPQIEQVNAFLQEIDASDTIFTVGYTLVVDSQKKIAFNITHHRVYDTTKCYSEQKYPALHCLDDLGTKFQDKSITYVIGDQRTRGLINSYDKLYVPFNENYVVVKEISPSISIYQAIED